KRILGRAQRRAGRRRSGRTLSALTRIRGHHHQLLGRATASPRDVEPLGAVTRIEAVAPMPRRVVQCPAGDTGSGTRLSTNREEEAMKMAIGKDPRMRFVRHVVLGAILTAVVLPAADRPVTAEAQQKISLLTWNIPVYKEKIEGWIADFKKIHPGVE